LAVFPLWGLCVLVGGQLEVKCNEDACIYEYISRIVRLHVGSLFKVLVRF
jgi:hypothetical protein